MSKVIFPTDLVNQSGGVLVHYTMSDNLEGILTSAGICLYASCFSKYWCDENTAHDDAKEFRGALNFIDFAKCPIRHKTGSPSPELAIPEGPGNEQRIGSTQTPYFTCFSSSKSEPKLFHRFCNPLKGVPVMLEFDMEKVLGQGCLYYKGKSEENYAEPSRQLMMNVSYFDERTDISQKETQLSEIAKAIGSIIPLPSESTPEDGNTKGDSYIDACLFFKRKSYEDETEIRYVVYHPQHYSFYKEDNQMKFRFDDGSDKNIQNIMLYFPIEILKSIVFGPCVEEHRAKQIMEKLSLIKEYQIPWSICPK